MQPSVHGGCSAGAKRWRILSLFANTFGVGFWRKSLGADEAA